MWKDSSTGSWPARGPHPFRLPVYIPLGNIVVCLLLISGLVSRLSPASHSFVSASQITICAAFDCFGPWGSGGMRFLFISAAKLWLANDVTVTHVCSGSIFCPLTLQHASWLKCFTGWQWRRVDVQMLEIEQPNSDPDLIHINQVYPVTVCAVQTDISLPISCIAEIICADIHWDES